MYRDNTVLVHEPPHDTVAIETTTSPLTQLAVDCRAAAARCRATSFSVLTAPAGQAVRLVPLVDDANPGVSSLSRALSARTAERFARSTMEHPVPTCWTGRQDDGALPRLARRCEAPVAGRGIAFPVRWDAGRGALFVFAGPRLLLDDEAMVELHGECFAMLAPVGQRRAGERTAKPAVSKRELQCLKLTANGLTSEDIASRLGLSVHTANQYLTNSTQKLNAVNRIHAVAKALRMGLID
jgi:DNA-binding CsgD family transcriptional regulator